IVWSFALWHFSPAVIDNISKSEIRFKPKYFEAMIAQWLAVHPDIFRNLSVVGFRSSPPLTAWPDP
ncbi:hypothetical protein PoB_005730600, partial [Plakobranchus ocellatus]